MIVISGVVNESNNLSSDNELDESPPNCVILASWVFEKKFITWWTIWKSFTNS